jgi:endoglucanase
VSRQYLVNNNIIVSAPSSINSSIAGNNTRALAGQLDATNFGKYNILMQVCLSTGAHCINDIHNYAHFKNQTIAQGRLTNVEFASHWRQFAKYYANQTNVFLGDE